MANRTKRALKKALRVQGLRGNKKQATKTSSQNTTGRPTKAPASPNVKAGVNPQKTRVIYSLVFSISYDGY